MNLNQFMSKVTSNPNKQQKKGSNAKFFIIEKFKKLDHLKHQQLFMLHKFYTLITL